MKTQSGAVLSVLSSELPDSRDLRMNVREIGKAPAPLSLVPVIVKAEREHDYRRSCAGKQNHRDPVYALMACCMVYRQVGHNVFPYKCRFCPNYHLGHTNIKVREFIAALLDFTVVETAPTGRLGYGLGDALKRAGVIL